MSGGESFFRSREERLAAAKEMNLFSNVFMSVALTDLPSCEYVLRIITGIADLNVIEVRRQYEIAKLVSRDGVLDILAEDGKGQKYNLDYSDSCVIPINLLFQPLSRDFQQVYRNNY